MGIASVLLIAALALLVGVAIGRLSLFQKNLGEALVASAIETGFQRPHVLLNNVTFKNGKETTQIDHLLITDTGIFVIETKHYKGWIFGSPSGTHWTQVIYKHKSRFQNPIRQNYGHVKTVQSLFTLPGEAFLSIVVFTGEAEFKSEFGPGVLKLRQLVTHLSRDRPVIFDERKMAFIIGRIEMMRLRRSLETDEYHLNSVRRRIRRQLTA